MTPSAEIEPGPHWWKASALTTRPTLQPEFYLVQYCFVAKGMSCYLYFFCLHCYLTNIHIFDYLDSLLYGLFTEVPTSPDNRGSTVHQEARFHKVSQTQFDQSDHQRRS